MRIAILTTFRNMPESYSLVNDVIDQVKTLNRYGHKVTFFSQQSCKGEGIECENRAIFPHFKLEKEIVNEQARDQLIEIFRKELPEFDVVITHDLMYLRQYVTYREAIMNCGVNVKWIHWGHSGNRDPLKLKMPRAKYIYMNYADLGRWAYSIGIDIEDARVVFNNKDPRLFFEWHSITKQIADKIDLFDRDIVETYPMCTTRMDSKGIDSVISVFGALKKLGKKVLLIICNSNARGKEDIIRQKIELAKSIGLDETEIYFTSTLSPETVRQVPRQTVRDLMLISNLFIFPSVSEVCSNVLLEASMCKQLLVLNSDFPSLFDFSGGEDKTCLGYPFGSILKSSFIYKNPKEIEKLAEKIIERLDSDMALLQARKVLQLTNIDSLYKNQLEHILLEDY